MTDLSNDNYNKTLENFTNMRQYIIQTQNNMETLLHSELGPLLSFQNQQDYFENIFDFMTPLMKMDHSTIPIENIQSIVLSFYPVYEALQEIASFKLSTDPTGERKRLIAELHKAFSTALEKLLPYLAYARCICQSDELETIKRNNLDSIKTLETQLDIIINESKSAAKQHESVMQSTLEEATISLKSISNTNKEAQSCLDSIQKIAAESVISHYTGLFALEAKRSTYWSWGWLVGTIICMGFILHLGITNPFWSWKYDPADPHQLYKLLGSKISVMSVLFFFLYWCAKNYMVLQHNITVNRHRQNALGTFEAFVKSAENQDGAVKNALLMQAAQCIFNQQSSGYCGPQAETDSHKLLELLTKTVLSGQKG